MKANASGIRRTRPWSPVCSWSAWSLREALVRRAGRTSRAALVNLERRAGPGFIMAVQERLVANSPLVANGPEASRRSDP
jgi:hypothetical protein